MRSTTSRFAFLARSPASSKRLKSFSTSWWSCFSSVIASMGNFGAPSDALPNAGSVACGGGVDQPQDPLGADPRRGAVGVALAHAGERGALLLARHGEDR